jgi:hypothetical protein
MEGFGESDLGLGVFGVGVDNVLEGGLGFDAVALEEGGVAAFDPGFDRVGVFLHQEGKDILTMGMAAAADEEAAEFEFVLEGGVAEGAEAIEEADGVFGLLLTGGMGDGAEKIGLGGVVLEDGDKPGEGFASGGRGSLGDDLLGLTIGLPGSDPGFEGFGVAEGEDGKQAGEDNGEGDEGVPGTAVGFKAREPQADHGLAAAVAAGVGEARFGVTGFPPFDGVRLL